VHHLWPKIICIIQCYQHNTFSSQICTLQSIAVWETNNSSTEMCASLSVLVVVLYWYRFSFFCRYVSSAETLNNRDTLPKEPVVAVSYPMDTKGNFSWISLMLRKIYYTPNPRTSSCHSAQLFNTLKPTYFNLLSTQNVTFYRMKSTVFFNVFCDGWDDRYVKLSLYRPWRPLGLREVEAPTFSDIRLIDGGKVVSPTRRPLFTPTNIPRTHFAHFC
jgi:hypothetical protein